MKSKLLKKYLCGYDTFIRHRCIAELIKEFKPATILDVGGEGALRYFFPQVKFTTANIRGSNVLCSGAALPFVNNSFDLVVSSDTLEHIPKSLRKSFCEELMRVSKYGVILCAPFGTPEHIQAEKAVLAKDAVDPIVKTYLAEHIEHGLPAPTEVLSLAESYNGKVFYQGDFRAVKSNRLNGFAAKMYALKILLNNVRVDLFWNEKKYLKSVWNNYTNRFFISCKK